MVKFQIGSPFIVLGIESFFSLRNNAYYREAVTHWNLKEYGPIPKDLMGWINKTLGYEDDPLVFVFRTPTEE